MAGPGRPRGRPKKIKAEKPMKHVEAARLVDKNSRTIVKIMQLLEVQKATTGISLSSEEDPRAHVTRHIEKLKHRLSRRLSKLAKWGDLPDVSAAANVPVKGPANGTVGNTPFPGIADPRKVNPTPSAPATTQPQAQGNQPQATQPQPQARSFATGNVGGGNPAAPAVPSQMTSSTVPATSSIKDIASAAAASLTQK